jgi:hypothetical protein
LIRSVALEILNNLRTLHDSQQIRIRLEPEPKTYAKIDLPEPAERCMLARVRREYSKTGIGYIMPISAGGTYVCRGTTST